MTVGFEPERGWLKTTMPNTHKSWPICAWPTSLHNRQPPARSGFWRAGWVPGRPEGAAAEAITAPRLSVEGATVAADAEVDTGLTRGRSATLSASPRMARPIQARMGSFTGARG